MILGAEKDTGTRIAELEKKKKELDKEIAMIRRGEIEVMDGTALRDRFMQFSSMARELLSDFRAVEHNFRQLDGRVREKIASWDGSKGELLEQIFGEREAISGSDQGRSFQAFWDFLMSQQSQEELTALLEKVFAMEEFKIFTDEKRLKRIHFDWLDAGEHTQRTVASLSGQLRRYLDNKAYLENKRIIQILDSIGASALKIRDCLPQGTIMVIDDPAPDIRLPMERPLYRPAGRIFLNTLVCKADGAEIDYSSLFEQVYVDKALLLSNIRRELSEKDQISLHDLILKYPLKKGLAELIAYMIIASENTLAIFDDKRVNVNRSDSFGREKRASIPFIIFNRKSHDARI